MLAHIEETPTADTVTVSVTVKAEEVRTLDTTSKMILMIGDSMLESFGPRLANYAYENGHDLVYVIWYSSGTINWGGCNRITEYIKEYNPDFIVICLGGNELFIRDIKAKRQQYVDNILSQVGNIPYVWVGPPNWKDDTGINEMLQSSCKKGTFYLSKNDKFERSKDGAHPTRASGAKWCDRVCKWIMEESAYPILLNEPAPNAGKKRKVLVIQPAE